MADPSLNHSQGPFLPSCKGHCDHFVGADIQFANIQIIQFANIQIIQFADIIQIIQLTNIQFTKDTAINVSADIQFANIQIIQFENMQIIQFANIIQIIQYKYTNYKGHCNRFVR